MFHVFPLLLECITNKDCPNLKCCIKNKCDHCRLESKSCILIDILLLCTLLEWNQLHGERDANASGEENSTRPSSEGGGGGFGKITHWGSVSDMASLRV